ncbi:MAG: molecular chaperone DnaJ [Candidatus Nealsonbacteria bacterium]
MDYYKILGVTKDASQEDIKKAFHKLAHQHHPHKGGDEKKFKEVNEAYQILSNKEKRAQYDRFGRVVDGPGGAGSGFGGNWAWGRGFSGQEGPDIEFEVGDLGDIFGDLFGFRGQSTKRKDFKKGKNIRIDVEVSLEEVLKGLTKDITLYKQIICSRCESSGGEPNTKIKECFSCRGTGQVQEIKKTFLGSFTKWAICPECKGEGQIPEKACNVCKGEGRIKGEENIKIFIPAGIDSNQVIRISEKGNAGKKEGASGDLFVRVLIKKHPIFERRGDDLICSIPISFSQAVLGGEIDILTLDKKTVSLKIIAGTESGKILRIKNKGIPHFSGFGSGDLYVELLIEIPKKPTKKQKEVLKKLEESGL